MPPFAPLPTVRRFAAAACCAFLFVSSALAFAPRQDPARFDGLALEDAARVIGTRAVATRDLPPSDALRAGWDRFAAGEGGPWSIAIDERSGLPMLATGAGLAWLPAGTAADALDPQATVDQLEQLARAFARSHQTLLGNVEGEFVLDRTASGRSGQAWFITFRQQVGGVSVDDARYDFQVVAGRLVAFGATRWAPVRTATAPKVTREAARAALEAYLAPRGLDGMTYADDGSLHLVPVDAAGLRAAAWRGARGAGYAHRLVWRFSATVGDEAATWVADVDALDGHVVRLADETSYGRVKGGVFPLSSDGIGPEGNEQPGFPLPFADAGSNTANDQGLFTCSTGSTVTTTLSGPYIKVHDNCGATSASATCAHDIDMGQSPDTDCFVASGASAGNTRAARTSFYHLNRAMEKGRAWLTDNTWLQSQVVDNINIKATCNAYWNGSVNFYRSGGGCRNTGELQGVFVHEWGHGLDANDGGGADNPSEAYADTVAYFESRESCVGRGFFVGSNCGGYGDPCLSCTGIRDQDWAKHQNQLPATPANFVGPRCGGGGAPCGGEVHCEAYVASEAVYDLATRDLPALGLDGASAWQLAEKLFYTSRKGSGGNAYNCSLPNSDGCNTDSWFHKFMVADDNDGNLNNGTPHGGAIYAAFARHAIACGLSTDPSNQSSSGCPPMAKPTLSADVNGTDVKLTWSTISGTSRYIVLRNDTGCSRGQTIIDYVSSPSTTYTDTQIADGVPLYYRVQAQSSNPACESAVSECVMASTPSPQGMIALDRQKYACGTTLRVKVSDSNAAGTISVHVWSTTEAAGETLSLTQTPAGSGQYLGTIALSGAPPAGGDGQLSIATGDTITVEYIDADDGQGGTNVARRATAGGDCSAPSIGNVQVVGITDTEATVVWDTDEPSDSVVTFGTARPPSASSGDGAEVTHHGVTLTGLAPCTAYYFYVTSHDTAGNTTSAGYGTWLEFQTYGDFGSGPEVCHRGAVTIETAVPSCGATLPLAVTDVDLDTDPARAETTIAWVSSTTEPQAEPVIVTEAALHSLRFAGAIALDGGAPLPDGKLQVRDGDVVTVTYLDASDGHGGSGWRSASVRTDCRGPRISGVSVDSITAARATIHFTTDEPGDTLVEWGTTPALGQTVYSAGLATTHAVALSQFFLCQNVYIRVRSTDASGNQAMSDAAGAPYAFRTNGIPGLYWRDTFEGSSSWTLGGEWEIGAPQGKGGLSFGFPDPATAYNNQKSLGHDLTGKGATPGDYEKGTSEKAATPTLNAGSWTHTKLMFARKLNASLGDEASLYICAGSCTSVFRTGSQAFSDADWTNVSYDVSSLVDGKTNVRLEFRQNGVLGNASGWNVDDVVLKDGSKADYAACGGCGLGPAFAGAASAVDVSGCTVGSVTVSWPAAAAWGTGGSGSYAIYRGTEPGFALDAAHRLASGVRALIFTDSTAPVGTVYYNVQAENDETCSSGPANHGVTDGNAVYVAVTQSAGLLPAAVSPLGATFANHAHVHLAWPATASAASYAVYRSASPQAGGFAPLATTDALVYEDLDQGASPATWFYLVKGINSCGQEGP